MVKPEYSPLHVFKLLLPVMFCMPVRAAETNYTAMHPGTVWLADDGVHIDCHGGNIIYMEDEKKYYWYGERYADPAGVACYSSTDLFNWVNEGVVLRKGVIQVCERPKVIYSPSLGKFVMWFHYDNSSYTLAHLAVAVADSATGMFTLKDHFLPNGHQSRDIGMYTDSTGRTWIIYAADQTNVTIRMVELTEDYMEITTDDVDIKAHCEGPGMCRYKGNYYLITSPCLGWSPGRASRYMAQNITGPYTNKGDPCIDDNAHNTFNSQSCFMFKIPGYINAFMYMGDRWNGSGNKNSQYVFLPVSFSASGDIELRFRDSWDMSVFTPVSVGDDLRHTTFPRYGTSCIGAEGSLHTIHGRKLPGGNMPGAASRQAVGLVVRVPGNGVSARLEMVERK
ncbi:MAG: family 43 glycosylhydrolase [Chitinispirillaceae bacterium]|nr:family 43 glycosylhydrolase [Chitinispirillaceae bacterium]